MIVSDSPHCFNAFIACPITKIWEAHDASLPNGYRRFLEGLRTTVGSFCDGVFLALEREQWGQAMMPAKICTPLDFREMERCDVVIAYPGDSCGVAVELGWASALRKRVILVLEEGVSYSPLIEGLGTLEGVTGDRIMMRREGDRWPTEAVCAELAGLLADARKEWAARRGAYVRVAGGVG